MIHTRSLLLLLVVFTLMPTSLLAKKKPNVIIFFADDISARELPIYGSSVWSKPPQGGNTSDPQYRASTPVLDKMANQGVVIKDAWSATICMPARAMMMSGRYAHLHKWWHNKDKGKYTNESGKKESVPVYISSPHTIAHVAKAGGYASIWAGKTQMGGVNQFGFDEGVFTPGGQTQRECLKNKYTDFKIVQKKVNGKRVLINEDTGDEVNYYQQFGWYWKPHVQLMNHPDSKTKFEWWPNTPKSRKEYGLHTYGPDVELDFVFDFMDRKHKQEEPFFVYHTTHLGHDGWDFFSSDINKETRNKWPATPKVKWENNKYTRTQPKITGDNGDYNTHGTISEPGIHSHINYIDYQVWLYMQKLEEMGEANNTVFIFCADNGTSGYGKNSPAVQKGVHVPMIIYAPCLDMTKEGMQDIVANTADIYSTVAEVMGVQIPDSYEVNGVSLIPYLTTNKKEHRQWVYSYHQDKQLIRGKYVLIDGVGRTYDVTAQPDDLISYPQITDWSKFSENHMNENKKLQKILPRFNVHDIEHGEPKGGFKTPEPLRKL
ncbi:sulfatase-like hydrolase/transferase [Saccharicrinis aurantiacus]|uniref:sulfatase-like hydrolase/transferase n=1 Tax=Saccharicrinis aurantiacus TaxID=1849719 RepID=UPI0009FA07A1|nr:sulfatase-like hydrolase/transferase [Saccharicrinis aurantiacus]